MYENSCINLSFPSAPGPQQGLEENDAREKLNPMSKIRQTQLLLSVPWSPGFGEWDDTEARWPGQGGVEHYGVGSGLLWLGLSPPLTCVVKQMEELG